MAGTVDGRSDDLSFLQGLGVDKCVFCHSATTRRKVLFCLHLCCTGCLTEHLSGNNTVCCARCQVDTPDPGPGRKQLDSLADWPDEKATASDVADASNSSDEGEATDAEATTAKAGAEKKAFRQKLAGDYPAVGRCPSCDFLLGDGRSMTLGHSKATQGHAVELFERGGGDESSSDSPAPHCQLHSKEELVKFCTQCKVPLCEKCCPAHSSHKVLLLEEAAEEVRGNALEDLEKENSDGEQMIEQERKCLDAISEELDGIDTDTADLSKKVTEDFEKCRQLLSQREAEVKADLDAIRWRKAKPLDAAKQQSQEQQGKLVALKILLSDLETVPLLLTSRGIEGSLVQSAAATEAQKTRETGVLGAELATYSERLKADLSTFRNISSDVESTQAESSGQVAYCNLFDPLCKETGITLSYQNQMAVCNTEESEDGNSSFKWQAVGGIGSFNSGRVEFSIQVLDSAINTLVGVVHSNAQMPVTSCIPNFLGWIGSLVDWKNSKGGKLGQPWQEHDIIRLSLDLDASKLSAVHDRSGDTDSIPLTGSLYYRLRVFMYRGGSVKLLAP